MRRKRLIWQLLSLHCTVVCAALIGLGWFSWKTLERNYLGSLINELELVSQIIEQQIVSALKDRPDAGLDGAAQELDVPDAVRVTVLRTDGQVVFDTQDDPQQMSNHLDRPEVQDALRGELGTAIRASATTNLRTIYLARPLRLGDEIVGIVRCAELEARANSDLRTLQISVAVAALLIAGLVACASYFLLRRVLRPVEEIAAVARRVAGGNHALTVSVPDIAELNLISNSINRMARQLEERSNTIGRQGYEQEAVLASMAEGVIAVDSQTRVLSVNKAAADLFGNVRRSMRGRLLQEVIRNVELQEFAARALSSSDPIEQSIVLRGEVEKILRARGTLLRDAGSQAIGAVIVLNDVTNFRRLENMRKDFVANVSHELKTPIASIKGFVETLLDGAIADTDDAQRFLKIIAKQADRLSSIIDDLLALSKIEQSGDTAALQVEMIEVHSVLSTALHDCQERAAERKVRLELECDPAIVAPINRRLLEQAIMNLIDNAINYSEAESEVRVLADETSDGITITVIDRGCGIPNEHLPRLFERFYRVDRARSRKLGGTGLGLAIVKHIVQAHRGRIDVQSTPGKGSIFTVHLPKSLPV